MAPDAVVKHAAILTALPTAHDPQPRMIHAYWGRAVVESWIGPWWRRRLAFAFPLSGDWLTMAQVILSSVGSALGGPLGGAFGRLAGSLVDRAAIDALSPARQVGPRLAGLQLQSTTEGAPMACVFGRMRVTGQIIWAARFKERRIEQSSGGGKGGPRTVSYAYSLSFAVALCEGPIDGVGRVWADGQVMDITGVTMRLHTGAVDQTPDPLIEAVEGTAPAYRGVAYVVFEDLPLDAYGDRPPQLMFEVFRRPRGDTPALEDRLGSVCLIPGAGEFVYATTPVLRRDGLTVSTAENVNNPSGGADIEAALDQLAAQLPNVRHVTLVVAWFGDDLRCGHCAIRPGVEQAQKSTIPYCLARGRGGSRARASDVPSRRRPGLWRHAFGSCGDRRQSSR